MHRGSFLHQIFAPFAKRPFAKKADYSVFTQNSDVNINEIDLLCDHYETTYFCLCQLDDNNKMKLFFYVIVLFLMIFN